MKTLEIILLIRLELDKYIKCWLINLVKRTDETIYVCVTWFPGYTLRPIQIEKSNNEISMGYVWKFITAI